MNGPKIALVEQESGWQAAAAAAERVEPVEDNNVENRLVLVYATRFFPLLCGLIHEQRCALYTISQSKVIGLYTCKSVNERNRKQESEETNLRFYFSFLTHSVHQTLARIFFMYTRRAAAVPYAMISLRLLARKRIAERTFQAYVKNIERMREIQQTEFVIYEFVVCTAVRFSVY